MSDSDLNEGRWSSLKRKQDDNRESERETGKLVIFTLLNNAFSAS
jgi:hypothetical protein